MKRKTALFLVLVCLLGILAGCGGKKDVEPQKLADELMTGAKFVDSLNPISDTVIPILYDIDSADYTSALVYCGTAATAEEIAIFKAADDAAAKRLMEAAQARVDHQIEVYSSYGPEAARTLENGIVKQSGDYVIVVICADSDGAKKIVDQYK